MVWNIWIISLSTLFQTHCKTCHVLPALMKCHWLEFTIFFSLFNFRLIEIFLLPFQHFYVRAFSSHRKRRHDLHSQYCWFLSPFMRISQKYFYFFWLNLVILVTRIYILQLLRHYFIASKLWGDKYCEVCYEILKIECIAVI